MLRKSIIAVALFSLLMTVVAWAQPAPKRAPQKRGIWGMETDFGSGMGINQPRAKTSSSMNANQRRGQSKGQVRPKSIGGGAAGGALVGGVVTPRRTRKP